MLYVLLFELIAVPRGAGWFFFFLFSLENYVRLLSAWSLCMVRSSDQPTARAAHQAWPRDSSTISKLRLCKMARRPGQMRRKSFCSGQSPRSLNNFSKNKHQKKTWLKMIRVFILKFFFLIGQFNVNWIGIQFICWVRKLYLRQSWVLICII